MNILIDTHIFLWLDDEPSKLSSDVQQTLLRDDVEIFLSVVSVWEIAIKQSIGKLKLRASLSSIVQAHQASNGIQILPVTLSHVLTVESLPLHHKDPFDRLLIAQSIAEDLTMVSADHVFASYPIRHLW